MVINYNNILEIPPDQVGESHGKSPAFTWRDTKEELLAVSYATLSCIDNTYAKAKSPVLQWEAW